MDIYQAIGQRIRKLRRDRGLTQVQLAEQLNVTDGLVGQWETAKRRISIEDLLEVTRILDGSAADILAEAAEENASAHETRSREGAARFKASSGTILRLISVVEELPMPEQEELLELARIKLRRKRERAAG